ncbi:MAG: choice-of-anchor Q domain-containing protein, partial [Geminicoccaceae bacterium]
AGGGIRGNHVTLTDSTVSDTTTTGAYAGGGGIPGGSVTVTNSTVSGNSTAGDDASGGGGIRGSYVTVANSTVTGNSTAGVGVEGGGIRGNYVTLANSIVAGNTTVGGAGSDVYGRAYGSAYSSILSNGLNIFGSAVDGSVPSDRENISTDLLFAALDPVTGGGLLADNGGPTQTIALRDAGDNPALAGADPADRPATDQRGEARPQPVGTAPDIGAFELDQSNPRPPPVGTTFVVTTTSDVTADDGQLTLREALALADVNSLTADRIEFAAEVQGRSITLAGSQLTASSDITIDGGVGVTVDANQASRVLLIQGLGTEVTLQHLTITGGRTTADKDGGGGGIRAGQTTSLALEQTTVSGNSTAGYRADGGGIEGDFVILTDSAVSGNSTAGYGAYGGGIRGHSVVLVNSTVLNNSTAGERASGGGIEGYSVTLTNSTVSGNSTANYRASGGGISGEKIAVTNSSVSNNSTAGDSAGGAGIFAQGFPAAVTLTNSTVVGNRAHGEYADGGGIFVNEYGALALTDSTVTGNTAGVYGYGGGLFLFETPYSRASATVRNSIVAGNVGGGGPAEPDITGRITTSNGHNIFGSDVQGAIGGDLEDVPASLLFVGGLADNGGPTQTIALRDAADNPALAGADPADSPATDQRGEARPQPERTAPDIGAFELNQTADAYNPITGTDRGEFLSGTSDADLIHGLGGGDRLWGRPGGDLLFGDAGEDVLAGKEGVDQMTGGADADRFLYRRPIEAPPDGPVLDQIMDFRRAEHDKIDLRPIDADQTAGGNQKFSFIGEQGFTRAGQVRYEEVAAGQFLVSGSTDRDPAPELAFLVHSAEQLEAADFLL